MEGVEADESVKDLPYVDFVGFPDKNKPEEYDWIEKMSENAVLIYRNRLNWNK